MNLIGNIIWLICGGLISAVGYLVGGIVLCVTIIGIPFGLQCFKLAGLVLMPFGRKIGYGSGSFGCLTVFANIIWLVCGGLLTALNHIFWGILLAITIIGIPFARQHFKLVEVSMMPFGKRID
ncbi:YccF domain-containing protein [Rurimicrobium arvi]|uniref:YccF domain-containing protein n=1 Tax=Rurimicrobium arvi TaxID=2049916 RepID=A0ABP8MT12_9BACT